MSPPSVRVHPARLIGEPEVLKSSILSSFAEASVPAQASSLIRIERGGSGVEAGVGGDVSVGVKEGVVEDVGEVVAVADWVGVGVSVGEVDGEGVGVGVLEAVSVALGSAVLMGVGVTSELKNGSSV